MANTKLPDKWLTIDPGEDTGWQLWEGTDNTDGGQTKGWEFVDQVAEWARAGELQLVVIEDWALYPWKLQDLGWDKCRTARFIGALTFICRDAGIPVVFQPASIKKTAEKAGADHLYVTPRHENRHQNDAIQHGIFYMATKGTDISSQPLPEDEGGGGEPD